MTFAPGGKFPLLPVLALATTVLALVCYFAIKQNPPSASPDSTPSTAGISSGPGESSTVTASHGSSPGARRRASRPVRNPASAEKSLLARLASIPQAPPNLSSNPFDTSHDSYHDARYEAIQDLTDHYARENPIAGIHWIAGLDPELDVNIDKKSLIMRLSREVVTTAPDQWASYISQVPETGEQLRYSYLECAVTFSKTHPREAWETFKIHYADFICGPEGMFREVSLRRSIFRNHPDIGFEIASEGGGSSTGYSEFFRTADFQKADDAFVFLDRVPDPAIRRTSLLSYAASLTGSIPPQEKAATIHRSVADPHLRDEALALIAGNYLKSDLSTASGIISLIEDPALRADLLQKAADPDK